MDPVNDSDNAPLLEAEPLLQSVLLPTGMVLSLRSGILKRGFIKHKPNSNLLDQPQVCSAQLAMSNTDECDPPTLLQENYSLMPYAGDRTS